MTSACLEAFLETTNRCFRDEMVYIPKLEVWRGVFRGLSPDCTRIHFEANFGQIRVLYISFKEINFFELCQIFC